MTRVVCRFVVIRVLVLLLCTGASGTLHADWYRQEWLLRLDEVNSENPEERARIRAALQNYFDAKGMVGQIEALKVLYSIDSPTAKFAARYASSWPREVFEKYVGVFTPVMSDSPLLLEWLIGHEATVQDYFANDSAGDAKLRSLEEAAQDWNSLLHTTGLIGSPPRTPANWDAYSAQNLRIWALKRVRSALKEDHWSEQERRILDQMEDKLSHDIWVADFPRRMKWLRWSSFAAIGLVLLWVVTTKWGRKAGVQFSAAAGTTK